MINKSWKKLLSVLLSVAMLLSLAPGIGLIASADTVSFTKVTDVNDITADNIGECTFDEAKAWVYDNWDAITDGVDVATGIDVIYAGNGEVNYISIYLATCPTKDDFDAIYTSASSTNVDNVKEWYTTDGDIVYLCEKPAAPAVSFTIVTDGDQVAADNIGECTFDEAKAWVYDNWDAVTNGVDPSTYIDVVYIVNGSARMIAFFTADCTDKDEFKAIIQSDYDADLNTIKGYYISGYDVVYVCSKAAAPAHVHSLTPHAAENADCTTAGNSAYWSCSCGMYFSDENGETEIAENSWVIQALGHNYDNVAYSSDETYHWRVCSRCNEDSPKANHTWGSVLYVWGDNNSTVTASHGCTVCGKQVSETVNTTTSVSGANCTEPERTTYTANFTKDGFVQQVKSGVQTGPSLGHNYENVAYSYDDTQHWKVCSRCNEDSEKQNHTWGDATYTWSGDNSTVTASHSCTVCGKLVSETVDTTSQVTAAATCTTKELSTFTAIFTKPGFTAQTKEGVETSPATGHDFSYAATSYTIIATCTHDGCEYHNNGLTMSIADPELTVYGGAGSALATLIGRVSFNAVTGLSVSEDSIVYSTESGDPLTAAPTDAGKYYAHITVEGATAFVGYEIAKAGSTAASVAANEWTFDGTAHALVTVTGEAAGGTMKYALGTAAAPGTFGDSIPEATDPDTYYVWYKVAGDDNHNDTDAVLVTVTVAHDEALDAVIAAIDAIGPVTEVLADQKAKIDAARAGYNALTPEQQTLVTNYATLLGAEADFDALFVFDANTQITISGVEKFGETLTATAIDVPAFITDAVVRWYNNDGILIGTGETYTLTAAEIGKSVRAELYSAEANDTVTSDFTGLIGKGVIKNYTLPTAAHVMYPQTLAEATLTGGDTGDIEGVWAWATPDAQPTSAQSGSSFELTFTPTGTYADLYEGFTTRLAVVVDPAPFEPQAIEDTASGLTFDAEFAQNVEIELTDIAYSQSAYLALLRASKKDDSGMTRLVLLKTIAFTINGEEADEAYQGSVTVTSYVGEKLAGQTVSVWFFIDGAPVNYVGTVGYDGVLVIENVAL